MATYYREFGMDPKKLLVTVYHEDDDAAALWRKIAGPRDDRIIRIAHRTIFGLWEYRAMWPCSKSFMIMVITSQAGRQVRQRRMVTALLKSGIWCNAVEQTSRTFVTAKAVY